MLHYIIIECNCPRFRTFTVGTRGICSYYTQLVLWIIRIHDMSFQLFDIYSISRNIKYDALIRKFFNSPPRFFHLTLNVFTIYINRDIVREHGCIQHIIFTRWHLRSNCRLTCIISRLTLSVCNQFVNIGIDIAS